MDTAFASSPIVPTKNDVRRILFATQGKQAQTIHRFPTGLANWVYDVVTTDGEPLVVRLTRPALQDSFAGALTWYEPLMARGVPLPALRYSELNETIHGFPVMILDRLPGVDLGEAYPTLTSPQKRAIADRIIAIQEAVAAMPLGTGFGYAKAPNDPSLHQDWESVLRFHLSRSRQRIVQAGVVPHEAVGQVEALLADHHTYLETVKPTCFLDDTTTKNVLVHQGEPTGIVDVDGVAYGDPLYVLALTRMALLSAGYDTEYTDYWAMQLNLSEERLRALHLYTAIFCADFLSEVGQRFNKDAPEPVDTARISHLLGLLESLIVTALDWPAGSYPSGDVGRGS
jgi:aminoglycoside phosphotransferase (APT) family kinase protein